MTLFSTIMPEATEEPSFEEKIETVFQGIKEGTVYLGAGAAFGSAALFARLGWAVCLPLKQAAANECLLLSDLCSAAAHRSFSQVLKRSSLTARPSSQHSWYLNQAFLSQIPTSSREEENLVSFLENRWLAKSTGFFPSVIDWVCPSFGIRVQVHPETTNSYARAPSLKLSQTYINRVKAWKENLPHPQQFPLILTRPSNLKKYFPSYLQAFQNETIQTTVRNLVSKIQKRDARVVVDLTDVFPKEMSDQKIYQSQFSQECKKYHLDTNRFFCVERVQQDGVGGIRLLPVAVSLTKEMESQHAFLLEWVSNFGLSANRVELDRFPKSRAVNKSHKAAFSLESKEKFISILNAFDENWKSSQPQKIVMVKGTLQILKDLLSALSEEKWREITESPTHSAVAQLSFVKIVKQLDMLEQEKEGGLFFDTASRIEQIHADLSSLLEIFSPFTSDDFPAIYGSALTCIPQSLKRLITCGVHATGMTGLTGIIKASGKNPRILYGENAYFECANAAHRISRASLISEASEKDWEEVDLILAQFNPVLRRIDFRPTEYKVEEVAHVLRKALNQRSKGLTLALDCTLDFINSPRVTELLTEFQEEIESGHLNVICFRSGLKFDLFGMDNYCGAPFYMIHNGDAKWASFNSLLTDPVLQTDRLSLNWFCLAFQNAAPQLDLYRKQIFDNTRSFLSKVPAELLKNNNYRIVPFEESADPAFIDIKVSGPFHQIRSAALVGGFLSMKCMEEGHPIFYRPSLGFYHPNFTMLFSEECSTIRLTLGLDPAQVDVLVRCFERINTFN